MIIYKIELSFWAIFWHHVITWTHVLISSIVVQFHFIHLINSSLLVYIFFSFSHQKYIWKMSIKNNFCFQNIPINLDFMRKAHKDRRKFCLSASNIKVSKTLLRCNVVNIWNRSMIFSHIVKPLVNSIFYFYTYFNKSHRFWVN